MTDELRAELAKYQAFLEEDIVTDGNMLVEKLTTLNTYLARTGYLLAEAKKKKDLMIAHIYNDKIDTISRLSISQAKQFTEALCYDQNFEVNWVERLSKTIVHQGDNIRTQVSFEKEQLKLIKSGY